jgi:hypothetical protein
MRAPLLAFALLLAAASASAGTVNLRWNACLGDGGVANRNFACNTNSGSQALVGSFILPHDVPGVTGNQIVVDIGTDGPSLPAWWDFKNAGTCRQSSLSVNFAVPVTAVYCADWADGGAVGFLVSYTEGAFGPSSARIRVASAVPNPGADLTAGAEYFSLNLVINNLKTVGVGACAGCSLGACIYLREVDVTTTDSRNDIRLAPGSFQGTYLDGLATWQGGSGVITIYGCPAATPTRNRTWGTLKSLYR